MSDTEQTLQIDLELEPTGEVVTEPKIETVATETTTEDPISVLQKQYNDLKEKDEARAKALEVSQRAEADARAQADKANREVVQVRTQAANTSFQSVEHAIAAIDSEIQVAKRDYASAMESADYTKAADAQDKIASANSRKTMAERDKLTIDEQRKRQTVVMDQPRQVNDPYAGLTPQSRAWIHAHPECVTDPEKFNLMMAAHQGAVKTNLIPDTPDYFTFIEKRLGYASEPQQPQSRPRAMPAAPPSREPSSAPGAKVSVNLSAGEVKNATDGTLIWNYGPNKGKPIGTQEMARRKALLQRDDKYRNNSVN